MQLFFFFYSKENTLFRKHISPKPASNLHVENENLKQPSCHCNFPFSFLRQVSTEKICLRPSQGKQRRMVGHLLNYQEVAHVRGMPQTGTSQSDVASHLAVNRNVIHRAFRLFQEISHYFIFQRVVDHVSPPRETLVVLVLSTRRQLFVTARTLQSSDVTASFYTNRQKSTLSR